MKRTQSPVGTEIRPNVMNMRSVYLPEEGFSLDENKISWKSGLEGLSEEPSALTLADGT